MAQGVPKAERAAIAERLEVDAESAALRVERRYIDVDDITFEISVNLYPADRYSVRTQITQGIGKKT